MASIVDLQFTDWLNDIFKLYDDDKLNECTVEAQKLLDNEACPRYHRIRTLILLGDFLPHDEANDYCRRAETLWRVVAAWHVKGQDEVADKALIELRELIDDLKASIDCDDEYDMKLQEDLEGHSAQAEEDKATHESKFGDENASDDEMTEGIQEMKSEAEKQVRSVVPPKADVPQLLQVPSFDQQPLVNRTRSWSPNREVGKYGSIGRAFRFGSVDRRSHYGSVGRRSQRQDTGRLDEIMKKPTWR